MSQLKGDATPWSPWDFSENWLLPGEVVPVDMPTTKALLEEIKRLRLRAALRSESVEKNQRVSGLEAVTSTSLSEAAQLDHLDKALQACHAVASGIEHVADRILGPVPQEAGKTEGQPPIESIERKLAVLIGITEGLHSRLQNVNSRLDTAV